MFVERQVDVARKSTPEITSMGRSPEVRNIIANPAKLILRKERTGACDKYKIMKRRIVKDALDAKGSQ
jgi:hypothetical protein